MRTLGFLSWAAAALANKRAVTRVKTRDWTDDVFMGGLVRCETLLVGYVDCFNAEAQRHRDAERTVRKC